MSSAASIVPTARIFLIHSGSLHKMLTALFKLVWNTQKTTWTNFFNYQGKMFFNIEKVLLKIVKSNLNALPYCFFHTFEVKVSNFY